MLTNATTVVHAVHNITIQRVVFAKFLFLI